MEILISSIIGFFKDIAEKITEYLIGQRKEKNDFYNKALRNRYELIYCPLRILLLETHITGASMRFYFKQRLRKALPFFKKLKIHEGLKRLSRDFDSNPVYEVEFGDFPMDEIKDIVKGNGVWADTKLLNLVQEADRSTYETALDFSHSDFTRQELLEKEKFVLAEHIWDTYAKLNQRFIPKA